MANKGALNFYVSFVGDGVSNTWIVDTATGPFALLQPAANTQISSAFSLSTTTPTAIRNVGIGGGLGVTATILLGVITFTFSGGPPANGTTYLIVGELDF